MNLTGDFKGEVTVFPLKGDWKAIVPLERAIELINNGVAEIISQTSICKTDSQNTETRYIKDSINKRDSFKCVYCNKSAKTIHKLFPKVLGGILSLSNCVTACKECTDDQVKLQHENYPILRNRAELNFFKKLKANKTDFELIKLKYIYSVNVDASYYEKLNTANIGLCINNNKNYSFFKKTLVIENVLDSVQAELFAIYYGLKELEKMDIKQAIIYSDCKPVINFLKGNCRYKNKYVSIIKSIKRLNEEISVYYKWIPRKSNSLAHNLSRSIMK